MKKKLFIVTLFSFSLFIIFLNATIQIGHYSLDSTRNKANEDRVFIPQAAIANGKLEDNSEFILGVFDGHAGFGVSSYICQNLEQQVFSALHSCNNDIPSAFRQAFNAIDTEILQNPDLCRQGSTAIIGYVKNSELILVNTGDSKAIVFDITEQDENKCTIFSTPEHKPNPDTPEGQRIAGCGGIFEVSGNDWRVGAFGDCCGYFDLAMSRAFGDCLFKKIGVIVDPEVFAPIKIMAGKTCAVFASDGLWDALDPEMVAKFVKNLINVENYTPNGICQTLVEIARSCDSEDDITIVAVFF